MNLFGNKPEKAESRDSAFNDKQLKHLGSSYKPEPTKDVVCSAGGIR